MPATDVITKLSPQLDSRGCLATIYSNAWEFSRVTAMISMLNRAGKQFVTPESNGTGIELLKVICRHDDRLKERTLEIAELLGSIKVIGPKRSDDDVLLELPIRGHL